MTLVSGGVLDGHEARATIAITQHDTGAQIELTDLWVAPGAPDVRLYVTPRADGEIDGSAIDLGPMPDRQSELVRQLPLGLDPDVVRAVLIYCKVYSVTFGSVVLTSTSTG